MRATDWSRLGVAGGIQNRTQSVRPLSLELRYRRSAVLITRSLSGKQARGQLRRAGAEHRVLGRKHHLGGITKQGNRLLRFVLGQAGHTALRADPDLKQLYYRVLHPRGKACAKVAVARMLLVRLYIMRRDHIDCAEFRRRGQATAA
jgi:hypothetical protein